MDDVNDFPDFPPELLRQPKEGSPPMKPDDVSADVAEDTAPATRGRPVKKTANGAAKPAKAKASNSPSKPTHALKAPAKGAVPAATKTAPKAAKGQGKAIAKPDKPKVPKASKVQLDKYGLRVGSLRSQAAAMYASKKGATLAEVAEKLGSSTQYNVLTALEKKGFKIERTAESGEGRRPVSRFKLI